MYLHVYVSVCAYIGFVCEMVVLMHIIVRGFLTCLARKTLPIYFRVVFW